MKKEKQSRDYKEGRIKEKMKKEKKRDITKKVRLKKENEKTKKENRKEKGLLKEKNLKNKRKDNILKTKRRKLKGRGIDFPRGKVKKKRNVRQKKSKQTKTWHVKEWRKQTSKKLGYVSHVCIVDSILKANSQEIIVSARNCHHNVDSLFGMFIPTRNHLLFLVAWLVFSLSSFTTLLLLILLFCYLLPSCSFLFFFIIILFFWSFCHY